MKCDLCKSEHSGKYGSGRFCSSKCARSFATKNNRVEINKKISASLHGKSCKVPKEALERAGKTRSIFRINKILSSNWENLTYWERRDRVFYEQKGKCKNCKIDNWLNRLIKLEYHHKDGNRDNNSRENVEYLCPNCHSQTNNHSIRKVLTINNRDRRIKNRYKYVVAVEIGEPR